MKGVALGMMAGIAVGCCGRKMYDENPKLKRKGRIQVDMSNLQTESYDIGYSGQQVDQPYKNPKTATNAEGMFIIQAIEHSGDTRGDEWYTTLVCTAINAVVPKTGITINAVD